MSLSGVYLIHWFKQTVKGICGIRVGAWRTNCLSVCFEILSLALGLVHGEQIVCLFRNSESCIRVCAWRTNCLFVLKF